ncbi:MAG: DUF5681 domain-containing protein [Candidatus Hodarchaeales archaeon]
MTFAKGQSGNEKGRPNGIKNYKTQIKEMIEEQGPSVLQTAIDMAKAGDTSMLSTVVNVIQPKPRERLYAKGLNIKNKNYEERMEVLDHALADGEIDLEVWNTMRQSYMKQHELDVIKKENESLRNYADIVTKLLKDKGIDLDV